MATKKTPIDPLSGPRYVLKGRIVTLDAASRVIKSGSICVEGGVIAAVTSGSAELPAEFRDAPRFDTRGTIYPGMIELHNHLSYDVLPLWQVPKKFGNRGQWADHPEKRRLVSGPMQVIAGVQGTIEALVRYVEVKCLVGGVTTSQGITLVNAAGIAHAYRGVVRNVEQTDDDGLPEAGTRIPDVDDAAKFLKRLESFKQRALLLHLAEGIDERARRHFQALKTAAGKWAIRPNLVGIHAAGLRDDDYETLAEQGGGMVWSPLSNLLLYGGTADIARAKRAGVRIALGSDWSPSGSKNLLGELKVALAVSEELGGVFKPEELVRMATSTPADLLNWENALGTIEAGKRSDFVVTKGKSADPYTALIQAGEEDLVLVIVNGVPRSGHATTMKSLLGKLAPSSVEKLELRKVGNTKFAFYLEQASADPLVAALTLGESERRLSDALRRLPELASASFDPLGASLDLGMPTHLGLVGSRDASEPPSLWRVELENEHDHGRRLATTVRPLAPDPFQPFFASNESLAKTLTSIELDALSVADDARYFERLELEMNLPEYLKAALPELNGVERPKPAAVGAVRVALGDPTPRASTLAELAELPDALSVADRRLLVQRARFLLEQIYVHLPLKRAAHAVDPVQRLRLLEAALDQAERSGLPIPGTQGIAFHRTLLEIFTELRDLHTVYLLPPPYRNLTAVLPFLLEEYFANDEKGARRRGFLVTKVAAELSHPSFRPGVEVLYWNGMPIEAAVRANGERQAGSNLAARFARGLATLTIRPLMRSLPPEEEWVVVGYRTPDGETLEVRLPWEIRTPGASIAPQPEAKGRRGARARSGESLFQRASIGLDVQIDAVNGVKRDLYARQATLAGERIRSGQQKRAAVDRDLATTLPGIVRALPISTKSGTFGYLRIFSFSLPNADEFLAEIVRLLGELPQRGLILDVRGNGGGLIWAAEGLLQLFTDRRIEPQRAQLLASETTLALARRHAPSPLDPSFSLAPWIESLERSTITGELHSTAHPITPEPFANSIGRKYRGPVALIADALCYSATDLLIAGFQDHDIGPIVAINDNIGAGGANVWEYGLLQQLTAPPPGAKSNGAGGASPFADLPAGCDFRVAVRRTLRVRENAGVPLEDLGIDLDEEPRYFMSRTDVVDGNRDLLDYAAQRLKAFEPRARAAARRPERRKSRSLRA